MNALAVGVALLQRRRAAKEVEPAQGRLPALPGKLHIIPRLGIYLLANKALKRNVIHDGLLRFIEIKAVAAVEVTARAGRFGHYVTSCHSTP